MGSSVEPGDAFRSVRIHIPQLLVLQAVACISIDAEEAPAATAAKSAFVFGGVGYLHRWSMNDQHEFTPEGQEDLDKWSEMITVNVYPSAHDGDALAAKADAVLENYKSHNARVLRTNSVPSPASLRGLPHKESRPSTTKVSSSESCGRHRVAMEEPESATPAPDFSQPSRPLLQFCGSQSVPTAVLYRLW
jgi:hypothetical protein